MYREMLSIERGDVISIVGSGGKTTTMFLMAEELKNLGTVLVTTTTKILIPKVLKDYELCFNSVDSLLKYNLSLKNKVVILGSGVENGKLVGLNNLELSKVREKFDYILIEADGSKKLPLKAWRENEPVILKYTTKTLGVIPADLIGKKLDYNLVFNSELFKLRFKSEEYFSKEVLYNVITDKEGIFKNSRGIKYIFFNRAEGEVKKYIGDVVFYLKNKTENINYIYGSNEEGYCEY